MQIDDLLELQDDAGRLLVPTERDRKVKSLRVQRVEREQSVAAQQNDGAMPSLDVQQTSPEVRGRATMGSITMRLMLLCRLRASARQNK